MHHVRKITAVRANSIGIIVSYGNNAVSQTFIHLSSGKKTKVPCQFTSALVSGSSSQPTSTVSKNLHSGGKKNSQHFCSKKDTYLNYQFHIFSKGIVVEGYFNKDEKKCPSMFESICLPF